MNLPKSRSRNIVVQMLGSETLIYDLDTRQAFSLNETASIIYRNCDGKTAFDEVKRKYNFTDDVIYFALDELKERNLLTGEVPNHFAGLTRREIIRRVGMASLVALPILAGLAAPDAVEAGEACVTVNQPCSYNNEMQGNCCDGLRCWSPSNFCADCIPSGTGYYITGAGGTVAVCNARPEKNRCCNNTADAVVNSFGCLCP